MSWKPVRKIAAEIWIAAAGNTAVAGTIATGTAGDWEALGVSATASVLIILAGYITRAEAVK